MKYRHTRLIRRIIAIAILLVVLILFNLAKTVPILSEYLFARGLSRAYLFIVGNLSNLFPFSLFEIFIGISVIVCLVGIVRAIHAMFINRKTDSARILLKILTFVLSVSLLYTVVAGGNYYRKELPLPMYQGEDVGQEKTLDIINAYYADFEAISASLEYDTDGKSVMPFSVHEAYRLLNLEYDKLDKGYFNSFSPRPKHAAFSFFMSYEKICGITFMPTGEVNLNYQNPQCWGLVTSAHEIAHAKGVMRESDANLTALYILLNSDVPYFRYCAYMYYLSDLRSLYFYYDEENYADVVPKTPVSALTERNAENAFWASKDSIFDNISSFFNDLYLKINGGNGVSDYLDPSDSFIDPDTEQPVIIYNRTQRVFLYPYLGQ